MGRPTLALSVIVFSLLLLASVLPAAASGPPPLCSQTDVSTPVLPVEPFQEAIEVLFESCEGQVTGPSENIPGYECTEQRCTDACAADGNEPLYFGTDGRICYCFCCAT